MEIFIHLLELFGGLFDLFGQSRKASTPPKPTSLLFTVLLGVLLVGVLASLILQFWL